MQLVSGNTFPLLDVTTASLDLFTYVVMHPRKCCTTTIYDLANAQAKKARSAKQRQGALSRPFQRQQDRGG